MLWTTVADEAAFVGAGRGVPEADCASTWPMMESMSRWSKRLTMEDTPLFRCPGGAMAVDYGDNGRSW